MPAGTSTSCSTPALFLRRIDVQRFVPQLRQPDVSLLREAMCRAAMTTSSSSNTGRAARAAIVDGAEILIDGGPVRLIDLSIIGAQVVSPAVLRPNQRVRISMVDERLTLRFQATVVWATFELPGGGAAPRYRAGVAFSGVDADSITDYATRHRRPRSGIRDQGLGVTDYTDGHGQNPM